MNNKERIINRPCFFCKDDLEINYKKVDMLKRYISDSGKIVPRRYTRTCAKHQRKLALEIKKARHIALLYFVVDISN
ncbi:MAG: 30S ribosomal protein S18 [Candidatus Delongbacteria bacterium]|nr:30S ribosomal protein S18 [Candidatus Delongbacteria bacterium]